MLAIWREIILVNEAFSQKIRHQVGTGEINTVRLENWTADRPLASQFPRLYKCAQDGQATVKSCMGRGPSSLDSYIQEKFFS